MKDYLYFGAHYYCMYENKLFNEDNFFSGYDDLTVCKSSNQYNPSVVGFFAFIIFVLFHIRSFVSPPSYSKNVAKSSRDCIRAFFGNVLYVRI